MGRRRNSDGLLDDLLAIAMKLPWWVSLFIALMAYILLHAYVRTTETPPKDVAAMGQYASHMIWRTFAMFFQYVIPFIFVFGAGLSAFQRKKTKERYDQTREIGTRSALLDMSAEQFERLVGEHFRRRGFQVRQRGGAMADGGVDIELTRGTEKFLVQCKQWRATKVSVGVVRSLYGSMAAYGASGGFVVSSGDFTADAAEFASGRNIELVDGSKLTTQMRDTELEANRPLRNIAPQCPKCGVGMVRRTAQRGPKAGKAFWGCVHYPKCTGIRGDDP